MVHPDTRLVDALAQVDAAPDLAALEDVRIARLMCNERLEGSYRRRFRRATPSTATHDDHVKRVFQPSRDGCWVTDITQHPSREGWAYSAVVIDVYSRRVVGLSIADHLKTELVIDALEVARLR